MTIFSVKEVYIKRILHNLPVDSFLAADWALSDPLSELADLSDMSDGGPGPPGMELAAFSEVRLTFSASNSIGPGLTNPVYFWSTNCSNIFSTVFTTRFSSSSRLTCKIYH